MACIGCGLGLNADGTGRVDVDTQGGLKCTGVAGGSSNTAGRGLAIKLSSQAGNSATVNSNGLYVPPKFRLDTEGSSYYGQNMTGPNNGSSIASPATKITLTNTSTVRHAYIWSAALEWGTNDSDPGIWMELAVRVGNANWVVPAAISLPSNTVVMPLTTRDIRLGLDPGQSTTIEAVMRLYRGFVYEYQLYLTAWGGPEEGQ